MTCTECLAVIRWRDDDPPGTPCAATTRAFLADTGWSP